MALSSKNSNNKKNKHIVQYSLSGKLISEYSSIREAVELTGLSRDRIEDTLYGKRLLNREFIWKYRNSLPEEIPSHIEVECIPVSLTAKSILVQRKHQYEYPYQDLHLADMEGEVWKEIAGLETYCMVSNMGRIKTLPRIVERNKNGKVFLREKIVSQGLAKNKPNKLTGLPACSLQFTIQIEGIVHIRVVARVVYSAFVKPLADFEEDEIFILHKNNNPFINTPGNLYAATRQELTQRNIKSGWVIPYDLSRLPEEKKAAKKLAVSQYTLNGIYLASYKSLTEAYKKTGVSAAAISRNAKGKTSHAGGFLWQKEKDGQELDRETVRKYAGISRSVCQYDENNCLAGYYPSIRVAAKSNGLSYHSLWYHLKKGNGITCLRGYTWKLRRVCIPGD